VVVITWVFMIITVASFKGGVGKTTTAVHLAAYFSSKAPTILVDGDPNESSSRWASAGKLPFEVVGIHQGPKAARRGEHLIIDTGARPNSEQMKDLAEGCDLLILPTTPDTLALDALMQTVEALRHVGSDRFRILLAIVPPRPVPEGEAARKALLEAGLPVFKADIRRTIAFPRAAAEGVTVGQLRGELSGMGWRDYEAVGEEVEEIHVQAVAGQ
jgi:chromosome partitioning protein